MFVYFGGIVRNKPCKDCGVEALRANSGNQIRMYQTQIPIVKSIYAYEPNSTVSEAYAEHKGGMYRMAGEKQSFSRSSMIYYHAGTEMKNTFKNPRYSIAIIDDFPTTRRTMKI